MSGAIRHLGFPLILFGALAAVQLLSSSLGIVGAAAVVQTAVILLLIPLEQLVPFRDEWRRSHGDLGTDIWHAIVSGIGTTQLAKPLVQLASAVFAAQLSTWLGFTLWPSNWPALAQLTLALLIIELPQYWLHRWQHEYDFLWRFHAVHHSAPRLYWLNAARFHPIDLGMLYVVGYLPLVLLGAPEETIILFGFFDAVFGMLQHCNVDFRLGPLNYVFSMAEPHRWHHSRVLSEANTNYGSNLIVYDLLFGSFFLPRDRQPPENIGIADMPDFPQSYLAQLAAPFRWRRLPRGLRA